MKLRALVLGLFLAVASMTAGAVKVMPESEAQEVCTYWASTYQKLAEFRDAGLAQKAMTEAIDRAEAQKKLSPDHAKALREAVRAVYANPGIPPKDLGSLVYEKCMADMTSINT